MCVKVNELAHLIPLGFRRGSETEDSRRISRTPEFEDDDDGDIAVVKLTGLESRTRVQTAFGDVPAHLLRVNDTVRGADGRFHRIRKIDVIQFEPAVLRTMADAYPIRICAGALRTGVPARDIYLAPEQELAVPSGGYGSTVVAARDLLTRPKVLREPVDQVAYFRLDLGDAVKVMAEKVALPVAAPKSASS